MVKRKRGDYFAKRDEKAFCICNTCGNKFASIMVVPLCKCGSRDVKVVKV